ncbi:helix-turn-helix domain-containing protein [Amycolatopsis sp. NPDC051371]|uniref:helix-turn-helix domain-containing protein n=1 Tax=Amycolatopsis sp. NPDC051371 TaxID=3155800 RepID=UPI00341447AC
MHARDRDRSDRLMDAEAMAKAYSEGASIGAIAEAAQRSYSWTRRLLLDAGVELRARSVRPCPIAPEQLAEEYAAGASILTLAERHDLYFKRIRELLLDHGVTLRPSTRVDRDGRA